LKGSKKNLLVKIARRKKNWKIFFFPCENNKEKNNCLETLFILKKIKRRKIIVSL